MKVKLIQGNIHEHILNEFGQRMVAYDLMTNPDSLHWIYPVHGSIFEEPFSLHNSLFFIMFPFPLGCRFSQSLANAARASSHSNKHGWQSSPTPSSLSSIFPSTESALCRGALEICIKRRTGIEVKN